MGEVYTKERFVKANRRLQEALQKQSELLANATRGLGLISSSTECPGCGTLSVWFVVEPLYCMNCGEPLS